LLTAVDKENLSPQPENLPRTKILY